ncbi:MAG: hypothetical protein H0X38_12775 [Planctomycetes bacterium]|nr:hypothetical protein [Planctomycetota bacterium]
MIISGSSLSLANQRRLSAAAESGQFGKLMTGALPAATVPAEASAPTSAPVAAPSSADSYVSSAGAAGDHALGAQVLGYLNDFLGRVGVVAAQAQTAGAAAGSASANDGSTPDPTATLTGILEKTFGLSDIASISWSYDASQMQGTSASASASQTRGAAGQQSDYQQSYDAYEHSTLAAQGSFTTSDGTSYSFSLDYERERMTHVGSEVATSSGDQGSTDASPGAQLGSAFAALPAAGGDGASDATDSVGGSPSSVYRAMQRMMLLFFDRNHDGRIDAGDADAGAGGGANAVSAASGTPEAGASGRSRSDSSSVPASVPATPPVDASSQSASVVAMRSRRISLQISVYAQAAATQATTVDATA